MIIMYDIVHPYITQLKNLCVCVCVISLSLSSFVIFRASRRPPDVPGPPHMPRLARCLRVPSPLPSHIPCLIELADSCGSRRVPRRRGGRRAEEEERSADEKQKMRSVVGGGICCSTAFIDRRTRR